MRIEAVAKDGDYIFNDRFERSGLQNADLRDDQFLTASEKLPWPGVACDAKGPRGEAVRGKFDSMGTPVRIAYDLAQNPVRTAGVSKNHSRSEFRLRQIRERNEGKDTCSCCRYDHAASSSGRFQSFPRVRSLNTAAAFVDRDGVSLSIITSVRRADEGWTGSTSGHCAARP